VEEQTLDTIYNGYIDYTKKVKGHQSYASIGELRVWEEYKQVLAEKITDAIERGINDSTRVTS
jgi:hypothetical protein